ncbi:hypothetical protein BIT28_13405 [Photobacterium proteolyticum]|uniref:Uncharacterized protein n=1 Tax=Photobacterium proteolyticum TaxID=1903952 RepID=A0A1Q9GMK7_9GAMM|nr:hypothetical protein [Photobacterium proteolyticum]OLQ75717.1 hypothetical protein BIT28_13405 [Photobacterium proteolyticum]
MRKGSPAELDQQRRQIIGTGFAALGVASVAGLSAPVFANNQLSTDGAAQDNCSRLTEQQVAALGINVPTFAVEAPQGETLTLTRQLRMARRYQDLLYLSYQNESSIHVYDSASLQSRFEIPFSDQLGILKDFAVSESGDVFALFTGQHAITHLSSNGAFVQAIGEFGIDKPQQLNGPGSLTIDSLGNIHVWDSGARQIKVFTPDNQFVRQYGRARLNPVQMVKSIDGRDPIVVVGGNSGDQVWSFQV